MSEILQALFTDLDCSLLNDEKRIGEKDLKTLFVLQQKGIKVFLATGRHFSMARQYAKQLNTSLPTISCNGAMIYDFAKETPLEFSTIPKKDVETLIKFGNENNLTSFVYTDKTMYFPKKEQSDTLMQLYLGNKSGVQKDEYVFSDSILEYPTENVVKFLFSDCNKEMYNKLLKTDIVKEDKLELAYSGHDFLDINVKGNTKGKGIEYLSHKYNFSCENTFAMGDNFNDVSMLSLCKYAVVPENASDEIKKFASLVTSSNNDNPITFAIEKLFPNLLK